MERGPSTASETVSIALTVNGRLYRWDVEPRLLLIDFLRDELHLMGSHIGCEEGICGACTVDIDGRTTKSCLIFAVQADGTSITTIESVAKQNKLDPVQHAFMEEYAVQCGYCTPGMIMSARALLRENPHPSEDEIRSGMIGNLCRCTGYQNIVRAVKRAATLASAVEENHVESFAGNAQTLPSASE